MCGKLRFYFAPIKRKRGKVLDNFFAKLTDLNDIINSFVWGKGLYLLLATGLIMTVITGVFQITHIGHWFKETIGKIFTKDVSGHIKGKSISQFQALCTALAATIGVGNIAGVAAAIVGGGPGAVFWMWIAAFLGMMTNYSENVLGIYYRRKNSDGEWSGGAMYYLRDGLGKYKGCKWIGAVLAVLFAIFAILASFGIGAMGQVNKIVVNMVDAFAIPSLTAIPFGQVTVYHLLIGVVLVIIATLIILGGLKRIANFAEKVVPFMVVLFVIGSLVIIGANIGTTVTGWVLSLSGISGESFFIKMLQPTSFTPVLAVIGIIYYMFCKKQKKKDTGAILLGFATLMFGMEIMSGAFDGLRDNEAFQQLFIMFKNPLLGLLVGAVLTAIIQSSSAAVGILQAIVLGGSLVPIGAAIPIVMGTAIGTCVTAMLSCIGTK